MKFYILMTKKLLDFFDNLNNGAEELAAMLERNVKDIKLEWFELNGHMMAAAQRLDLPIWPPGMDCIWEEVALKRADGSKFQMRLEFIPLDPNYIVVVSAGDRGTYPSNESNLWMAKYPDCLKYMEWVKVNQGLTDGHHRIQKHENTI
jgi:hypothetical protein